MTREVSDELPKSIYILKSSGWSNDSDEPMLFPYYSKLFENISFDQHNHQKIYHSFFPISIDKSLETDTTSWVRVLTVTPGPTSQPLPHTAGC